MMMTYSNTLLVLGEIIVLMSSCSIAIGYDLDTATHHKKILHRDSININQHISRSLQDQQHTEWYLPNDNNDGNSIKKSWLLGAGDSTDWGGTGGHKIPQQINIALLNGEYITGVSAGGQHSAVVTNTGRVLTAGSTGDSGALGRSISSSGFQPVTETVDQSSSLPTFVKVVASQDYTLAIDTLGNLWSTGTNSYGQLCQGDTVSRDRLNKVQLPINGGSIVDVVAGERHTLIRQENGKVWGCGWNEYGQLGIGVKGKNALSPVEIKIDDPDSNDDMINHDYVTDMSAGRGSSYFLTSSAHVYAAGTNYKGQLCLGHRDNMPLPARITDLEDGSVESIAAGMSSIFIQLSNSQVLACGDDTNVPSHVPNVTNIKAIFSGPASLIAYLVDDDQSVYTAGSNGLNARKNWQVPDALLTCVNKQTAQNRSVDISTGNDHTLYLARIETTLDCLDGSAPTNPSPTQLTTSIPPTHLPTAVNPSFRPPSSEPSNKLPVDNIGNVGNPASIRHSLVVYGLSLLSVSLYMWS